jgi:hypothetical protein
MLELHALRMVKMQLKGSHVGVIRGSVSEPPAE